MTDQIKAALEVLLPRRETGEERAARREHILRYGAMFAAAVASLLGLAS